MTPDYSNQTWIAISERVPAVDQPCLVWMAHDEIPDGEMTFAIYQADGYWYCEPGLDLTPDEVTHWMPLPEPPQ